MVGFLWILIARRIDNKMESYNEKVFQYFSAVIQKAFLKDVYCRKEWKISHKQIKTIH